MPRYKMPEEGGRLDSISASALRAAIRAGEKIESGWLPKPSRSNGRTVTISQTVLAVNASRLDIPLFGVVRVESPYETPFSPVGYDLDDARQDEDRDFSPFLSAKSVWITAPLVGDADSEWLVTGANGFGLSGRYMEPNPPTGQGTTWVGIAQEPIARGSSGAIAISGISKCLVRIPKGMEHFNRAGVQHLNVESLHIDPAGSFEILWQDYYAYNEDAVEEDDEDPLWWCVVRFSTVPDGWVMAHADHAEDAPPPFGVVRLSSGSRLYDGFRNGIVSGGPKPSAGSHRGDWSIGQRVSTTYVEVDKYKYHDWRGGGAHGSHIGVAGAIPWKQSQLRITKRFGWVYIGDGPVHVRLKDREETRPVPNDNLGPVSESFHIGLVANPDVDYESQYSAFGFRVLSDSVFEDNGLNRHVLCEKSFPRTLLVQMERHLTQGSTALAVILNIDDHGLPGDHPTRPLQVEDVMLNEGEVVSEGQIGIAQYIETSTGQPRWILTSARNE